jgi:glycine cleavage system aminomethyltransferase T
MTAPLKQSQLYHVSLDLGASFGDYHGWNLASHFATPAAEVEALKTGVGICDASWLGKLEIQGRHRELESLTIEAGRTWELARGHYLVLCDPAHSEGIARLVERQNARSNGGNTHGGNPSATPDDSSDVRTKPAEDPNALELTGSPRTDASLDSNGQNIPTGDSCLHLADVTSTYAGLLFAGPLSRDVLQRLTAPDVSDTALPNGSCLSARVAGLHTRVVRDDLDETLAYWLLLGTEYAAYAWEAIMHAGGQFGIVPAGQEAARQMRGSGE